MRPEHIHIISPKLEDTEKDLNFLIEIDQGDLVQTFGNIYPGTPVTVETLPGRVTHLLDAPELAWKNAEKNKPGWAVANGGKSYDAVIDLRRTGHGDWAGLIPSLFYYVKTRRSVEVYLPDELKDVDLMPYLNHARAHSGCGLFRMLSGPRIVTHIRG